MFNSKFIKKDSNKALSILAGINRPIRPAQVTKLAQSINKMGVVRPLVVAVCSWLDPVKLFIIDGQHLFNALLRNNLDIPYTVIKIENQQDLVEKIALLNASSVSWSMLDYVTAWASVNPNYLKLKEYYNIYDFDFSSLAAILSGKSNAFGFSRVLKNGTFTVMNEEANVEILNNLTDVLKILPRLDRNANRFAISEYITYFKANRKYNHKTFLVNLQKNKSKFKTIIQEEGMFTELFKKINLN